MNKEEIILTNLKNWLNTTVEFDYHPKYGLSIKRYEQEKLRDGQIKDVYIIQFWQDPYIERNAAGEIITMTDPHIYFAYYDAHTLEMLYVMTEHGYIERDGTF